MSLGITHTVRLVTKVSTHVGLGTLDTYIIRSTIPLQVQRLPQFPRLSDWNFILLIDLIGLFGFKEFSTILPSPQSRLH